MIGFQGLHLGVCGKVEEKRKKWLPQVTEDGSKVTVTFFTYSGLERETLCRRRDTFRKGSYCFKSRRKDIASGPGGMSSSTP